MSLTIDLQCSAGNLSWNGTFAWWEPSETLFSVRKNSNRCAEIMYATDQAQHQTVEVTSLNACGLDPFRGLSYADVIFRKDLNAKTDFRREAAVDNATIMKLCRV